MSAPLGGRYVPGARLGGGGVAEVCAATDRQTGAVVAVKWLLPQLAEDARARRRFLREAALLRALAHPNVLPVLDEGEAEGRPFLVLPLAAGGDLRGRLRRGALGWPGALPLARALAHAHAAGVVHGDLKPENVLLVSPDGPVREEDVRLADFGLARAQGLASLTGSTLLWGSPAYLAPERFARGKMDPRGDLYALGVVLFEAVTGRLPWTGKAPLSRLAEDARGVHGAPPPTGHAGLDAVLAALLAADPADRPPSAEALLDLLEAPEANALVPTEPCLRCGRPRPTEAPLCVHCGARSLDLDHIPGGPWRIWLLSIDEDPRTMTTLHRLMEGLTGRTDLRLTFLTGDERLYSAEERERLTKLPAMLFSDLDEPTARRLETLFLQGGLNVVASRTIGLRHVRRMGKTWVWQVGVAVLPLAAVGYRQPQVAAALVGMSVVVGTGVALFYRRRLLATRALFRLREGEVWAPAGGLLDEALAAAAALQAPDVRRLLLEVVVGVCRLLRRAEGDRRDGAALASRFAALLTEALGRARRLDALDQALGATSESDLARALAQGRSPPARGGPARSGRARGGALCARGDDRKPARPRAGAGPAHDGALRAARPHADAGPPRGAARGAGRRATPARGGRLQSRGCARPPAPLTGSTDGRCAGWS